MTEVRIPQVGEVLVHHLRSQGKEVRATVVKVSESPRSVAVQVNGKEYPSLSAAASEIAGTRRNGWIYWGLKKLKANSKLRQ